jgi:DnaJ like chaperone protein
MYIWGKIIGFLFGFMLSKSFIGALLGAWFGHMFDRGRANDFSRTGVNPDDDITRQAAFFYTTFSVMGHMAKASGPVTQHEIAFASAYMDKLGLSGELRQQAQDAFREGKATGFPLTDRLRKFKRSCGNRADLLLLFLEIQIQVAYSDGELAKQEHALLHSIAKQLGYSASALDKLLGMIAAQTDFHQQRRRSQRQTSGADQKQQLNNAYKLLGVKQQDALRDIKKAYKKLMSQHHPDKLVAKGLPPEMMEVAKQKTQDIQAAYDLITKQALLVD